MAVHNRADVAVPGRRPAGGARLPGRGRRAVRRARWCTRQPGLRPVHGAAGRRPRRRGARRGRRRRRAARPVSRPKRAELLFAAARAAQAAGPPGGGRRPRRRRPGSLPRPAAAVVARPRVVRARCSPGTTPASATAALRAQAGRIADRLDALGAEEAPTAHLLAGRLAAEPAGRRRRPPLGPRGPVPRTAARRSGTRPAGWPRRCAPRPGAPPPPRWSPAGAGCSRRRSTSARSARRSCGRTRRRTARSSPRSRQRHAVRRGDARMLLLWTERWRASALAVPPVRPPDDPDLVADLAALRDVVRRLDAARATGCADRAGWSRIGAGWRASIRARTRRAAGAARPDARPPARDSARSSTGSATTG